jgi:monovalent cation:H+ antiporter, CPA1 family
VQTVIGVETVVSLLLVTLAVALFARRLRLPYTLVLVIVGLILGVAHLVPGVALQPEAVLFIFLPALLFEGAWSLDFAQSRANWPIIALMAVPGLLLSLGIVALVLHWGLGFDWLTALLVGAIISPTDPVAVLALLRQLGLSPRLRTIVEGESLFNDGVGAVAFVVVLALLPGQAGGTAAEVTLLGVWQCIGGPFVGVGVGVIASRLLRRVEDPLIETTVTICAAYGAFLLSQAVHTSGLLAVVVAGIIIGSVGRDQHMSDATRIASESVWEFVGYVANSLLFLLVGLEIGATNFVQAIPGILWAVLGVLVGRALMIYGLLPAYNVLLRRRRPALASFAEPRGIPVAWYPLLLLSGLRGALSLALVLSLPTTLPQVELVRGIVYGVVLVTLLGQGIGLRVVLPLWPKGEIL